MVEGTDPNEPATLEGSGLLGATAFATVLSLMLLDPAAD